MNFLFFIKKLRTKKICLFISLLFISIAISSCSVSSSGIKADKHKLIVPKKQQYSTRKVEKGTIVKSITDRGIIIAPIQKDFSFSIDGGYLKSLYFNNGEYVKKGDILAEIHIENLENQIKEQEINYKIAQLNYEELKENSSNKFDIENARLKAELEKCNLDKLRDKMSKTKLISDMNGLITFSNNLRIGQAVSPGTNFYTIANTEKLLIDYINENATELKVGSKVIIDYNNKNYFGTVIFSGYKRVRGTTYDTYKACEITVKDFPKDATIGDIVVVNAELMKVENVINIPITALHSGMGRTYVYILDNGNKVERNVEVGIAGDGIIEIKSGLSEGEDIIIN